MKLSIAFLADDPRWQSLLKKERVFFRKLMKQALQATSVPDAAYQVAVLFADDAQIHALNKTWRGKDRPTNVLSFPMLEAPSQAAQSALDQTNLGDIILAYETVRSEARDEKKTLRNHVAHLLVHGMLHLCGYDHLNKKDAAEMEGLEIHLLGQAGIRNPYL